LVAASDAAITSTTAAATTTATAAATTAESATISIGAVREHGAEAAEGLDFRTNHAENGEQGLQTRLGAVLHRHVQGLQVVMDPVIEKLQAAQPAKPSSFGGVNTAVRAVGAKATGIQVGTILGYFSSKVLGQYEVFSGAPGQLLLSAPNVVEVERKLGVDPTDFRLWVALHEVTHRTQFTAVPWMRGYFLGEVQAFVDASQSGGEHILERLRRGVATLSDAVKDPDSRASVLDIGLDWRH